VSLPRGTVQLPLLGIDAFGWDVPRVHSYKVLEEFLSTAKTPLEFARNARAITDNMRRNSGTNNKHLSYLTINAIYREEELKRFIENRLAVPNQFWWKRGLSFLGLGPDIGLVREMAQASLEVLRREESDHVKLDLIGHE
jgi:hypothetical protein